MPKLNNRIPKYRKHRPSGRAVVTLGGKTFYLGPHGTEASRNEYDRLIAEWVVSGRQLPVAAGDRLRLTVSEVIGRYWQFADGYYQKEGKPTSSIYSIKDALRPVLRLYGQRPAREFGPLALKACRQVMIDDGLCRRTINKQVGAIRRWFRWAVAEELVPSDVLVRLLAVSGLLQGRTTAPDHPAVDPISEADIQATLPYLSEVVGDMVRFQRATGCRPAECCIIRPGDVDRSGEVWEYRPRRHKTQHHGKTRVIFIGPKGQAVLLPYLLRDADAYCFSPIDAEKKRRAEQHAQRKTPAGYGNGTNRRSNPKRELGACYTSCSYRSAVHRAADKAGIERWGPNRLRHSAGTEVRVKFGLEAAQVTLGHAKADITQIYAERDFELARTVAKAIG